MKSKQNCAMENQEYFGKYTLSQATLDKLREAESLLKRDPRPPDIAWNIIKPKSEKKEEPKNIIEEEVRDDIEEEYVTTQPIEESSTQFFFSQRDQSSSKPACTKMLVVTKWLDVAESLIESLECTNETIQLVNLRNLSDDDAESVVKYISEKLSIKGTYNLCHSICAMNVDQSMRYIRMTCRHLLLNKIINLEEPSRLMSTVIHELVEKFPDDVQEFIYAPMLNASIHDTSVFLAIINSYPPQRKNDLILNFLDTVEELKEWHINVLSQLITSKVSDNVARDKMLNLLLEKASVYSHDKNYGKFILSFMKFNIPLTDNQKGKLLEIVAVNETIFKRVMENLLNNMYLYGDLWYIA